MTSVAFSGISEPFSTLGTRLTFDPSKRFPRLSRPFVRGPALLVGKSMFTDVLEVILEPFSILCEYLRTLCISVRCLSLPDSSACCRDTSIPDTTISENALLASQPTPLKTCYPTSSPSNLPEMPSRISVTHLEWEFQH